MQADLLDILVISTSLDLSRFELLLGDGNQWGMHFRYPLQNKQPRCL